MVYAGCSHLVGVHVIRTPWTVCSPQRKKPSTAHALRACVPFVNGSRMIGTMQLDHSAPTPLYQQVAAEIRRAIADGEAKPGERMPLAKDLAAVLGVNRNTVLRALAELRDEGLLEFRRGRGITVAGSPQRSELLVKVQGAGQPVSASRLPNRGADRHDRVGALTDGYAHSAQGEAPAATPRHRSGTRSYRNAHSRSAPPSPSSVDGRDMRPGSRRSRRMGGTTRRLIGWG